MLLEDDDLMFVVDDASHRHSSEIPRLRKSIYVEAKSSGAAVKSFRFNQPCSIFPAKPGLASPCGGFYKTMNASPTIRDALLVQRMKHWLLRARHSFVGCPKWRARRNYWFLVRKHRIIAERYGLRETDCF
jgi:hypothetical protein